MKFFNWLLKRTEPIKEEEPIIKEPVVGEYWKLKSDDPFPLKYPPIEILDVKNGWVRYKIGRFFKDERSSIETFIQIYEKYEGEL